ncbi:mCG10509, isoform CRA_b [Mus musculus]|nr:mCG10509, isoform CRA_b [Mus musculus]
MLVDNFCGMAVLCAPKVSCLENLSPQGGDTGDDPTQDTKRHIIHQNPATLCLYNHRYRGVLPLRFPYFREHRISQMLFVQDSSGTTWSKPVVQFTITDNRGRFTLRKVSSQLGHRMAKAKEDRLQSWHV